MSNKASMPPPPKPNGLYRRMYYIRVLFAIIGGIVTGVMNLTGVTGLSFGILLYVVTYMLFRYGIPSFSQITEVKKFYLTGVFSFFLIWFVFWVISINMLYPVTA